MLLQKFPEGYDYSPIADVLNEADVRIANVEMVLTQKDCFASTFCGGQWLNSDPSNFDELCRYGFNMFAGANNHSMDYSFDGVLSTVRTVGEIAGIGADLAEASRPIYQTVNGETVALISCTTTFIDAARAGYANQYFPARPGVNALRHKEVYYCTQEQMDTLRTLASTTYINGERDNARKIGSLPPEPAGTLNFGGIFFQVSEKTGKKTTCHEADLKRIIGSIEEARQKADYVVVMPHSHNIKRGSYTEPDYFFEDFCHKAIDAGADCIFGGGTHQLKPVEIYHDKPIFYSLGNFIFQTHLVDALPYDFWEKYGYSLDLTIPEALAVKSKNGTIGLETDKSNYLSFIPLVEFEKGKVTRIELTPISLQFEADTAHKGLPIIAHGDDVNNIYKTIQKNLRGGSVQLNPSENISLM